MFCFLIPRATFFIRESSHLLICVNVNKVTFFINLKEWNGPYFKTEGSLFASLPLWSLTAIIIPLVYALISVIFHFSYGICLNLMLTVTGKLLSMDDVYFTFCHEIRLASTKLINNFIWEGVSFTKSKNVEEKDNATNSNSILILSVVLYKLLILTVYVLFIYTVASEGFYIVR